MKFVELEFYGSSYGHEEELFRWRHGGIDKHSLGDAPPTFTRDYLTTAKNIPSQIRIWSKKQTTAWINPGKYYAEDIKRWNNNLPYIKMDFDKGDAEKSFIDKMTLMVHLEIIPISINLHYFTDRGQGTESSLKLLPDNDVITLKATKGFVESTYKWQYQVSGESTWHDMPNTVSYSEGNSVVTFKGTDLYDQNTFNSLIQQGKNILFRINAITDETRNEADYKKIILTPTYSAPHILSHDITLEQCHQSGDASIRIFLDRPLWPSEVLAFFQVGGAGFNVNALDAENSFRINNLVAGTYTYRLRGTHNNGLATYTETPNHILNTTISNRPAITHSFTQKNVSCFSGHDGEITLTASGGTGNFTAELMDAGGSVVQRLSFSSGSTIFKQLSAGNYTLRVQDSNGCVAKSASGEELIHQITLTEPDEAVSIKEMAKTSPLAYQSSDGSIQIAVSGGSPSASGYTVRFIRTDDGQAFAPTDSRPDGNQFIYTLRNIPRGEYTAVAEDMRYSSLGNEDKQEPCGCHAQLVIALSAPPLLTVEVEETHFVSCHDDSDGELTAHGKGGKPIVSARLPYTYTWYKISGGVKEVLPLQIDSIAHNLVAGQYQVKITDANGITAESAVFELKQPDLLTLSFTTRPPSCNSGSGLISTTVTGGTPPYTYEWNKEGATEANLAIEEAGSFFVRVVDSRGCSITGNVEVTAPDAISIKPTITNPTCHDANNGAISLELSGGTAPYTIHWEDDNNTTTANRENLKAGEYVAVITDKAGCTLHYRVVLEQPEALIVKLGEGFTLCHEQSRKITALPNVENVTYQWFHNGQQLQETSKELIVSKAGKYRVVITNENGCTAMAEIEIKTSSTALPLDMTAPTSVTAGTPIHAVNISRIRADKLEWMLPANAIVTGKSDERVTFTIPEAGIYEITLVGYLGDCSTVVTQRLEVLAEGSVVLPDGKDGFIRQFLVTPNPTTGDFKVYVELKEPHDFTLRLLSPTGAEMDRKAVQKISKHTFEYELRGDIDGTFGVELSVGNEKSTLKITKKKK
ncbi:pectate lyase [Bacteroides pyogenes]|nr:pectate lyase [Bacteroides pyogenes]